MVLTSEERNAKILQKSQAFWKSTIDSIAYKEWFNIALKCERFANGNSWNEIESTDPKNLNFNLIAGYIHSLIGEQLKTKTSVSVRSHELLSNPDKMPNIVGLMENEYQDIVLAYNSALYREYEVNNILYYQSQTMKDTLVYGMGGAFFDIVNGERKYSRLNPLYIVPDLSDETIGFDDSEFVGQLIPMSRRRALILFPKISQVIGNYVDETYTQNYVPPRNVMMEGLTQTDDGRTVFIKMIEWKTLETSYSGFSHNGRTFITFDEEIAEKNSVSKNDIVEGKHDQIHRSYFCGDVLLNYYPLKMSFPREQFSIVTTCLSKKASKDGFYIPKSLVESLLDLQKSFDTLQSKAVYLSDSKKMILDPSVTDSFGHSSPEDIKREITSSTSLLFLKDPKNNVVDFSLQTDIRSSMGLAEDRIRLFDLVTGINREQRGFPTNAQTGIAIRERQIQSITSNIYAFNEFAMFKKKVGRLFIQQMQMEMLGIEDIFMPAHPIKSGNIVLNQKEKNKDKLIRDVNFLPLDIYIEESPEFLTSKDEQRDLISSILQHPYGMVFLLSPTLRKSLGIYMEDSVAQEFIEGMKMMQGLQQGVSPNQPSEIPMNENQNSNNLMENIGI